MPGKCTPALFYERVRILHDTHAATFPADPAVFRLLE